MDNRTFNENGLPVYITGKSSYGLCSCCGSNGVVCCAACLEKDDCNSCCGWLDEDVGKV